MTTWRHNVGSGARGRMQQNRLAFVDTLRAVAALAVLAFHVPLVADGHPLLEPGTWLDRGLHTFGSSGVDLFFVVSGFVLCLMAPHYDGHRRPVVAFYIKRLLRIAPLFYVVLLAWIAMFLVTGRPVLWWQIAAELTFTFNLHPATAGGFAFADWTIGVEMLFYAVFPVLYRLVSGAGRKLVALLLAFVLFEVAMLGYQQLPVEPATLESFRWLTVFRHLPSFVLGMLCYDLYRQFSPTRHASALGIVAMVAALLVFAYAAAGLPFAGRFTVTLGWGLMLLASGLRPWFFVGRSSAFIGRISYSMYLWHGPVIMAMGGTFAAIFALGMPQLPSLVVSVAAALLVALPVAWVSYRFIETPGNRLASWLVRRLDRPALLTAHAVETVRRSPQP